MTLLNLGEAIAQALSANLSSQWILGARSAEMIAATVLAGFGRRGGLIPRLGLFLMMDSPGLPTLSRRGRLALALLGLLELYTNSASRLTEGGLPGTYHSACPLPQRRGSP